jgi:biopolymer transport protein ExbD
VPLIDIMFFLLAAFMLVSLSLVNRKSVKVNLPTATTATPDTRKDFVNLSVDQAGLAYLDTKPIGNHELVLALTALQKTNAEPRVFISGDRAARHGDVIRVLLLAGLCVVQWRDNRRVNLEAANLTRIRHEQVAKLDEHAKTIAGLSADLDRFRARLQDASALAKEAEAKLRPLEREVRQVTQERDQLKGSVTDWSAAVTVRDERLKEFATQLQELAAGRNEAVTKFNDLAGKYNAVVIELNAARARLAALATNGPSARRTPEPELRLNDG